MTTYSQCGKDVLGMAERLIQSGNHGPAIEDLGLAFMFRDPPAYNKGRQVIAKVGKPPDWIRQAFDFDYDLVIELNAELWNKLTSDAREAMVDFALCQIEAEYKHTKMGDVMQIAIMAPDVQAYRKNLTRYGLWHAGYNFADAAFQQARQIELPGIKRGKGKIGTLTPQAIKETIDAQPGKADPKTCEHKTTITFQGETVCMDCGTPMPAEKA